MHVHLNTYAYNIQAAESTSVVYMLSRTATPHCLWGHIAGRS